MNVIADIKITTEDGKVLFDEKRNLETETHADIYNGEIVDYEILRLKFIWIEKT